MYKEGVGVGVTELEFSTAIASLTAFAEVDLRSLQTLHDLSAVGSSVGRSLRIVTLVLGEKNPQGRPAYELQGDTRYLNRSDDEGSFSYLVVTTAVAGLIQKWDSPHPKDRSDPDYSKGYWIIFPIDFSRGNLEIDPVLLRAGVGTANSYNLRRELDPEAIQGYAIILQESLKDLIPTFRPL